MKIGEPWGPVGLATSPMVYYQPLTALKYVLFLTGSMIAGWEGLIQDVQHLSCGVCLLMRGAYTGCTC